MYDSALPIKIAIDFWNDAAFDWNQSANRAMVIGNRIERQRFITLATKAQKQVDYLVRMRERMKHD